MSLTVGEWQKFEKFASILTSITYLTVYIQKPGQEWKNTLPYFLNFLKEAATRQGWKLKELYFVLVDDLVATLQFKHSGS